MVDQLPPAGGDMIGGRLLGRVVLLGADREPACREAVAEPVEISVGLALARVPVGNLVEARRVTGLEEMYELVDDHPVEHPLRDGLEAGRDPDLPGVERA